MIAIAPEDRIPHDKAVWRDGRPPEGSSAALPVSVDYGSGKIIATLVGQADWKVVKRWRWGWA